MIYTVTFNPSLDYIVSMEEFVPGQVNRTETEIIFPGGKGINVSMVLKNMGIDSTALGFIAGFTGDEIRKMVQITGCQEKFIKLQRGWSRINLKLRAKEESEINGKGPEIHKDDMDELYRILSLLKSGDILVLAGSIPDSIPDTAYSDIMRRLQGRGVKVVVDATKELLMNVIEYKPFLIKPNHHELGEIFKVVLKEKEEVLVYARKLKEMGAQNVLISMAGEGAVLVDGDGNEHISGAPKGKVVNSVGAGDSMVAGFLTGFIETGNYENAFKMGIAAGSASAFSEKLATRREVEDILTAMSL